MPSRRSKYFDIRFRRFHILSTFHTSHKSFWCWRYFFGFSLESVVIARKKREKKRKKRGNSRNTNNCSKCRMRCILQVRALCGVFVVIAMGTDLHVLVVSGFRCIKARWSLVRKLFLFGHVCTFAFQPALRDQARK